MLAVDRRPRCELGLVRWKCLPPADEATLITCVIARKDPMSTTSAPEVVHDGSVERTVDPEEVSLAAAYRVSSTVTAACASEPPPCGHAGRYAAGCAGQLGKREDGADLARRRLGEGTRST